MPSTELINGLISLVLTLLVLSLLVQALQELVKAFLHVKARHLENALRALLSKAGLCACAVTDLLTQIAVGFGRTHAVRTQIPAAKTISKKEILLWLDARPIGASITGLKPLIEAVEERLNQAVTGSAAPTFALIESTIRDFLATLPNRDEELTFERTAAEPSHSGARRHLEVPTGPCIGAA